MKTITIQSQNVYRIESSQESSHTTYPVPATLVINAVCLSVHSVSDSVS